MSKHAWLVMTHNQPELLKKLLKALDNKNADIFLHIDNKSQIDIQPIISVVKESKCYLTDRINVIWGGFSQIATELLLLETATKTGRYDFYHLITGSDYLLKPVMEVQRFYEEHKDFEFISSERVSEPGVSPMMKRCIYYYPFQNVMGLDSNKFIGAAMRKVSMIVQRILHIQRNRDIKDWYVGSAYFDISDTYARYLVDRKSEIKRRFNATRCADELFLQIMFYNSPLVDSRRVYKSNEKHPYIQTVYLDVKRAIDWTRGIPYVWKTDEDYEILKKSGCLIARKFDYEKYPEIVDRLEAEISISSKL